MTSRFESRLQDVIGAGLIRDGDAPLHQLPAEHDAYPKLLVLDTNHWVGLAREHYEKSSEEGTARALRSLRDALRSGRLVLGIHAINALEAMQRHDQGSRERLVRFMVETAANHFIARSAVIAAKEAELAVLEHLGRTLPPGLAPRESLLVLGAAEQYPPSSSISGLLNEGHPLRPTFFRFLQSAEMSVELMVHVLPNAPGADKGRDIEAEGVARFQAVRDADIALSPERRLKLEYANAWSTPAGDRVRDALARHGVDAASFYNQLDADGRLAEFWRRIPSVTVPLELEIASARNAKTRAVDSNDLRDKSLYRTSVPYANILVTEKYWCDRLRHAKLDKRFGCRVLPRLADLPAALVEEGCI